MPWPKLPGLKTLGCVQAWGAEGGLGLQPPQASPHHHMCCHSYTPPTHSRERKREREGPRGSAGFSHPQPENGLTTILLSRTVLSW